MKTGMAISTVCLILAVTFSSSSCSSKTGAVGPSINNSVSPKPKSSENVNPSSPPPATISDTEIFFYSTHTSRTNATFKARVPGFPDGTIVLSQLYRNDGELKPETWWPSSQEFKVMSGLLTIFVDFEKISALVGLSAGPSYQLKVWVKDHPEITGGTSFDLNGPPGIDVEFKGYPDGASYMPGQVTNTTLAITNVSSTPFTLSPFPPEISIRPSTSNKAIRHFAPGSGEVRLKAGEITKYLLGWDQKDNNGNPVAPGLYIVEVLNVKTSNSPQVLGGYVISILIQSP